MSDLAKQKVLAVYPRFQVRKNYSPSGSTYRAFDGKSSKAKPISDWVGSRTKAIKQVAVLISKQSPAPPAPQGSGEHKLVDGLKHELPPKPYRYLTSEEAERLPLSLRLERLREINEELVRTHNHVVIQGARDEEKSAALRATLAEVEVARDQALALGAEQVLEIQELRQVVQWYRSSEYDHGLNCWEPLAVGDFRCSICIKADALLEPKAKLTQQEK